MLEEALGVLTAIEELRAKLVSGLEPTILDEWVDRNRTYDRALSALYEALRESRGRTTVAVQSAAREERIAREGLPADRLTFTRWYGEGKGCAVGLAAAGRRRAAHCSNGMRRRAEFARMLITKPDLLLLDEAHVGLDPEASALVEHLVAEVVERGGGAVVVSHERDRAARIVQRTVVLSDGRIERGDA